MAIIATDGNRFSAVVKREFDPASAYCRDAVTYNGTAVTLQVGAVLGAFIASPVGTAGAVVGTGNGTIGAVTATSVLGLELGTYVVKITKAVATHGDFEVLNPSGRVVGLGQVDTAFAQDGLAFTITHGSTDFVAGDYLTIVVTGTVKYKLNEATATDGSQIAKAVFLADNLGLSRPTLTVVNTDTSLLALTRGPAIVDASALTFGASVAGAALVVALAQLKAVGIIPETQD